MRYVIYGAGAIGGAIGGRIQQAGREVVLIARGRHLQALRADGLTLQTPEGEQRSAVHTAGSVRELSLTGEDVVLLAMKSQDTAAALDELAGAADADLAVVCAQNGVANERAALRRFERVYGMFVWVAAQLLEPGVIQVYSAGPVLGVLDLGRVPRGSDDRAEQIAADLRASGFASRVDGEIMRWKYGKLLSNLANAVQALLGPDARGGGLVRRSRDEALACYAAAGIDYAGPEEIAGRVGSSGELRPVGGVAHKGGSSWQSLARGTGSIETAYLNGEVALLGSLHGVATPVNRALSQLALRAAQEGVQPGSLTEPQIEQTIARD